MPSLSLKTFTAMMIALSVAPVAFATAAEGESTLKVDALAHPEMQPPGEDVDTIITNKKMRAQTGSKSKYSISTSVNYSGGSVVQPFGNPRPNITGSTGTTDVASLAGSIGGKYSISTVNSITAGTGARMITPLDGGGKPAGYQGDKYDIDNPNVGFQHLYRWYNVQSALNVSETVYTNSNLVRQGFVTSWGASQNNAYDLGNSGFTIGVNVFVSLGYFNRNDPELKKGQSDYGGGLSPALEYRVTDNLSLHTDTNLFSVDHLRSNRSPTTFHRQDVSQNFGLGYAVARDFYVSPGVSFDISNLRADRTTWSIGANVNLF